MSFFFSFFRPLAHFVQIVCPAEPVVKPYLLPIETKGRILHSDGGPRDVFYFTVRNASPKLPPGIPLTHILRQVWLPGCRPIMHCECLSPLRSAVASRRQLPLGVVYRGSVRDAGVIGGIPKEASGISPGDTPLSSSPPAWQ